jgi:hypothetical protein
LAQRKARTGSITPERQGRPPGKGPLSAHADVLISWVDAEGDVTMPELAVRLFRAFFEPSESKGDSHRP